MSYHKTVTIVAPKSGSSPEEFVRWGRDVADKTNKELVAISRAMAKMQSDTKVMIATGVGGSSSGGIITQSSEIESDLAYLALFRHG